jgi:hypothetical protein
MAAAVVVVLGLVEGQFSDQFRNGLVSIVDHIPAGSERDGPIPAIHVPGVDGNQVQPVVLPYAVRRALRALLKGGKEALENARALKRAVRARREAIRRRLDEMRSQRSLSPEEEIEWSRLEQEDRLLQDYLNEL